MRRFLWRAVLLTLTALFFCTCAYGDVALYRGASNIGSVPTIERDSQVFVPVEDVAKLLGFSASRSGEEVLLSRGSTKIRVINNSAAAWRDLSIAPLQSTPFENNGKLWIDSYSAISLFQNSTGSGAANRLRFNQISRNVVTARTLSDADLGIFPPEEEPKPAVTVAANPLKTSNAVVIPPAVDNESKTEPQPEPVAQKPVTPPSTPKPTTTITKTSSSTSTNTKKQPKYEAFKLNDSKTEAGEYYDGDVQNIRWTSQEGEHKKVRAVLMVNANAEPQVYMDNRELHALFSSSLERLDSFNSPYENVKLEAKKNSKGIDLVFKVDKITKAEKIVLNNPRRIVFDFFFPANVNIVKVNSAPQVVASKPAQPVEQVQPKPTPPAPAPTPKPAAIPAATTTTLTPAAAQTQTQPQNILVIPMKKGARKTIVVDPGHGGKDPGASDNGVTEKNVNLAIGLELQKVLLARGYNVIMTRNTDVYLKLQERTDIANNANADLFVSIHVNALPNKKSMTGFEIYIMALPTDKDAMNLAKIENREYVEGKGLDTENVDRRTEMLLRILGDMQQNNKISESTEFAAALYNSGVRNSLPMRRVAQAPFFVLRGAGMPAVLLETGFVTNAAESQLLMTQAYQQKIANAMAEGIINYLR